MLTCPDDTLPPRPEMARYVGLHNFAKIFCRSVRRGGETEGGQDERCFQIRTLSNLFD